MSGELVVLVEQLDEARAHVLATVDGLDEEQLTSVHAPVGWSISQLLNHLTFDDEIFWGGAIVGGDHACIALITDGWRLPTPSGADAIARYRRWSSHTTELLHDVDLNSPPRWWPPREIFPFPAFPDARRCVLRLLAETHTHAGHLDIIREGIDGHQHLVVS